MASIYQQFHAHASAGPGRVFLTAGGGAHWSYAAFDALSARMAGALAEAGAGPGDRVLLAVEKSAYALGAYLACLRAGLVVVPLNTAYTAAELAHPIADCAPRVVVCDPLRQDEFRALAPGASILALGADGAGALGAASAPPPEPAAVGDATLAALIYTSGTTGKPKGVMLTHANLASNAAALAEAWGFTAGDVLLHVLPLFHVHGLFISTNCVIASGASMILHEKFDAGAAIEAMARASVFMGVPTHYHRLLREPRLTPETTRNIRLFVSGSAPLLAEAFAAFEQRTGQRILERYGMSEAGVIASNPLQGERRPGAVGPALPGVAVRIAGGAEVGEVEIRGPGVFAGYWNDPQKTADSFTDNGWFRTGDVGSLDADGYLRLVGRAKDLIISGGYNVYPMEVEDVLNSQPGVEESAVFGVPHEDFGEAVVAAVVFAPGAATQDADALIDAARRQLAPYKTPKKIVAPAALPRNAMGKVQKNVLRATYADLFRK